MSNNTQTIPAEHLVILSNRIRVWSGTVKVEREEDLPTIKGSLPPKDVMADGRKVLVESKHLAPLESVRKAIERSLKADGFPFAGAGVAVTAERARRFLEDEYPRHEQDYQAALDDLCDNLPQHYADMESKAGPEWSGMLQSSRLTATQVRGRCQFGMNIFRMAEPDDNPDSAASAHYRNTVAEAFPALVESVRADAEKVLERVKGKARMLQPQLAAIKKLLDKLRAFAFLDPRVGPATKGMQSILASMPTAQPLDETNAAMCVAVLEQLVRPETILAHGAGVIADPDSLAAVPLMSGQTKLPLAAHPVRPEPEPAPTPSIPSQRAHALSMSM